MPAGDYNGRHLPTYSALPHWPSRAERDLAVSINSSRRVVDRPSLIFDEAVHQEEGEGATALLPPRYDGESFLDYTRRIDRQPPRIVPDTKEKVGPVSLGRQVNAIAGQGGFERISAEIHIDGVERLRQSGERLTIELFVDERGVLHLSGQTPPEKDRPVEVRTVISMPD